jgi:enoyl-CoA hydratase/carnithine racemase
MLNDSSQASMLRSLQTESVSQMANFASKDVAEAMAAFLEKRPPNFTGA